MEQTEPKRHSLELSIRIFRRYITTKQMSIGSICIDASQVISKACYEDWLNSRRGTPPRDPPKRFQRYLTCHLTGSDGREFMFI